MFEDSLVVSQIRRTSSPQRWTTLASISLQFSLAALVIALPLLHPERLVFRPDTPRIFVPPPPKSPVPVQHVQSSPASSDMPARAAQPLLPPRILPQTLLQDDDNPVISPVTTAMGAADGGPDNLVTEAAIHTPHIAVIPAHPSSSPVRVSSGVSAGMLLAPIRPVYPAIARAAHVEGEVIVEAIISRTGTIESLHAVSGPAMLRQAALDAIRSARYQPYRLNGSPTEVQTTITVNFRLGS
jgi:protein TonB